jgi:actin-like ATPase involved in cell morphogenesis
MSQDPNRIRIDMTGKREESPGRAPAPEAGKSAAPRMVLGKGLDVGTANLLSAVQKDDGSIVVKRERNMFLEIPSEFQRNRDMLTKLNVPYVSYRDRLFVLGDAAFDLANMFGKEVRRPMSDGFLSPDERDAIPMLRFIIERLLGPPSGEKESVYFCVPAPSIDTNNDTVYHQGIIDGLLRKLGYQPTPINEGHAVVYAELADQDFTGIGISCGGGMFNVCVAYKTIPAVTFSVSRGGDWIDAHVAKVMGIPRTRATNIKEAEGLSLTRPRNREEEAVVLYYRNLVEYVLRNLAQRFTLARDVPQFTQPVEIVVSGGTSLVGGFVEVFAEELRKVDFPLTVAGVRRAEDPLTSVVRGCLIAAALDQH